MLKLFCLTLTILLLTSCASMIPMGGPGSIGTNESRVNGTKGITLYPAFLYGTYLSLGLRWTTTMKKEELFLDVETNGLKKILDNNSLIFKVDGKRISLSPVDSHSKYRTIAGYYGGGVSIPTRSVTGRTYKVDKFFIEQLVNAKESYVRLDMSNSYEEQAFHKTGPTVAINRFKVFLKDLKAFQGK